MWEGKGCGVLSSSSSLGVRFPGSVKSILVFIFHLWEQKLQHEAESNKCRASFHLSGLSVITFSCYPL